MKIALLGGTFDPPHLGHVFIAQQMLDFGGAEEVWFVPNYQNTFQKPAAPVENRLAMTRMIAAPRTSVSTLEIDHKLSGQTIELLPHLPGEHSYVFVIGSDQLAAFHLWGDWEKLLQKIPFLVFHRYGYPNEPLYPGMSIISDTSIIATNMSSTKIRERVRRGLSIDAFVPPGVAEYIKKHKLYV